jgi:hypothetical protein
MDRWSVRPVGSTPSQGSPITPPRHTVAPVMATSTRSGMKAASVAAPIPADRRYG